MQQQITCGRRGSHRHLCNKMVFMVTIVRWKGKEGRISNTEERRWKFCDDLQAYFGMRRTVSKLLFFAVDFALMTNTFDGDPMQVTIDWWSRSRLATQFINLLLITMWSIWYILPVSWNQTNLIADCVLMTGWWKLRERKPLTIVVSTPKTVFHFQIIAHKDRNITFRKLLMACFRLFIESLLPLCSRSFHCYITRYGDVLYSGPESCN